MQYEIINNTNIIAVNTTENTIAINNNPNVIEVAGSVVAIKGDKGDTGEILPLTFTYPLPSLQWVINHNRGYYPVIIVKDVFGYRYSPNIIDIDENTTQVTFDILFSGIAVVI